MAERDSLDMAMLGAIKAIIEVIASKGLATHEEFAVPLRHTHALVMSPKSFNFSLRDWTQARNLANLNFLPIDAIRAIWHSL